MRNILAGYLRRDELRLEDAITLQSRAEDMMTGHEHVVPSDQVLRLTATSSCSACDCEFVALAEHLRVPLVTADKRILRDFPTVAMTPSRFLA